MVRKFGRTLSRSVFERVGRVASRIHENLSVSSDVLERDDAYLVVFDAPGASSEDVHVRFNDNEIRVRIDRFRDFRKGYTMRFPGRGLVLEGTARLPHGARVHPEEATATLKDNGTLIVQIPKMEE